MGKQKQTTKEPKKQAAMSFDEKRAKKRAKKQSPDAIQPIVPRN